jgi:D-proline reductase (dithiol) PrdB
MIVDSYRFLPRSFRPLYENPVPEREDPVWTPFERRLADAKIALLTSSGLYLEDHHEPFDLERERNEPTWGDPTVRVIPQPILPFGVAHLHISQDDILADPNIALPAERLDELVESGMVGSAANRHYSVMGFQGVSLEGWREIAAPQIIELAHEDEVDGLILAPV